jgi:hypothetical protein
MVGEGLSAGLRVMDTSSINVEALRLRLRLALDIIMAHRISKGLSLDRAKVTSARDTLEERVLLALEETDTSTMPAGWTWQAAAESISIPIALAIVQEQKHEPPEAFG